MITKYDLKRLIENDKPKTALEYLRLITLKYKEYDQLENPVFVKMAEWSGLINDEIIIGERKHSQWNKLNHSILKLINLLEDKNYEVQLPDSLIVIAENSKYGTNGRWIKKIAQFFGVLSALFIIGIFWISLDRKHLAFRHFFSNIKASNYQDALLINKLIGNWELEKPYVIRRDTIKNCPTKIYYTIGKKAEVYLFGINSNRLAGNEYIVNTIYAVNPKDTLKLDSVLRVDGSYDEILNKISDLNIEKISDINVVFHEELIFDTNSTGFNIKQTGSRTGYYVGPFEPENPIKHFFLSYEKKRIVEEILDKYNRKTIRSCEMKYDEAKKVLEFKCESVGDIDKAYIKRVIKTKD